MDTFTYHQVPGYLDPHSLIKGQKVWAMINYLHNASTEGISLDHSIVPVELEYEGLLPYNGFRARIDSVLYDVTSNAIFAQSRSSLITVHIQRAMDKIVHLKAEVCRLAAILSEVNK